MEKLKEETSCGAVLYRRNNDKIEYLIIKDRNDNYAFPKGHNEEGETYLEAAKREIKEEVGLDVELDEDCMYSISYLINEGTIKKNVHFYLGDCTGLIPYINDGEVKEILFLNYEDAYNKCTYDLSKKVLFEANNYLMKL